MWVPFDASKEAPSRVRRWLAGRLPEEMQDAANVAASEIVTNALEHGGVKGGEVIEVGAAPLGERWRVSVRHRGELFEAVLAPAVPGSAGGWGLRLVDALTVAWGVEHDGAWVTVWFDVQDRRREGPR